MKKILKRFYAFLTLVYGGFDLDMTNVDMKVAFETV